MRTWGAELRRSLVGALVVAACLVGVTSAQAAVLDPGPPSIESLSVSQLSSHRATLVAQIDPDQLETTFQFWVEYANCQNVPAGYGECDSISLRKAGEGTIPAGPDGQYVSATVTHLQGEYAYAYWVVAANSAGEKESPVQTFRVLPSPGVDAESVSGQAPNPIELHATIDPHGQAVYYQFQLVTDPSEYDSELTCPETGVQPIGPLSCTGERSQGALPIGRLEAGEGLREVSLDLREAGVSLRVGSTYHYRVLVAPAVPTEDTLQWEGPPSVGADQSFSVGEDNVAPPTTSTNDRSFSDSTSGGGAPSDSGQWSSANVVQPTIAAPLHKLTSPHARPRKAKRRKHKHHRHHRAKAVGRR